MIYIKNPIISYKIQNFFISKAINFLKINGLCTLHIWTRDSVIWRMYTYLNSLLLYVFCFMDKDFQFMSLQYLFIGLCILELLYKSQMEYVFYYKGDAILASWITNTTCLSNKCDCNGECILPKVLHTLLYGAWRYLL